MVHIVLVGGLGNVGREIMTELIAQGKHKVTVFTRKDAHELKEEAKGYNVVKVDYQNKASLVAALLGTHTVLSFIVPDPGNVAQKTLIAACVEAGVKRFAPNEWGGKPNNGLPFQDYKVEIQKHLRELNKDGTVLEYCLFQPGVFMNYIVYPRVTASHLFIGCVGFHLDKRYVVLVGDGEDERVWTTVQDVAKVVVEAIDYEEKWPEVGGIVGDRIKQKDVLALLQKYIEKPFMVHRLSKAALERGEWDAEWLPPLDHPTMPQDLLSPQAVATIRVGFELKVSEGASLVNGKWNELLPDFKFTSVADFLEETWQKRGKGNCKTA